MTQLNSKTQLVNVLSERSERVIGHFFNYFFLFF
jgi:hypothetical protein